MPEAIDYSDDILNYLRERRGKLTPLMTMIWELTARVKDREQRKLIRGRLLSDLARLTRQKKVIRYRKVTMVRRKSRSAQGLLRISEHCC